MNVRLDLIIYHLFNNLIMLILYFDYSNVNSIWVSIQNGNILCPSSNV